MGLLLVLAKNHLVFGLVFSEKIEEQETAVSEMFSGDWT